MDMVGHVNRQSQQRGPTHRRSASVAGSLKRTESSKRSGSVRIVEPGKTKSHLRRHSADHNASSSYSSSPEGPTCYAIPQTSVPRRSSSQAHTQGSTHSHSRNPSIRIVRPDGEPLWRTYGNAPPPGQKPGYTVPAYGRSHSPVKFEGQRLNPVASDIARRAPSKTYIRSPGATGILDAPAHHHPRVRVELQASAPLFVGGGTIEGHIKIIIDDNEKVKHRRSLGIGETVGGNRRASFLALGTDLLDFSHPPPSTMLDTTYPLLPGERFWPLKPSVSALPFVLSLPLDTGPPPFQSKKASIRFLLSVTATIRDAGRHYRVRTSQDVYVLATYDPERALSSLVSPLVVSDELALQRWAGLETLRLTVGLHRQVWVSGGSIFADVYLSNKTHKSVKRLDLKLERVVLTYKHGAAASVEKRRVFDTKDSLIVAHGVQRQGTNGWAGVEAYTSDTRTCELEVSRGHATVRCGKYFEVRYFLNVTACVGSSKMVTVQLPITLVHMNSLDVLPNSVAQVAAAIEQKRQQRARAQTPDSHCKPGRRRSVSSPAGTGNFGRRPSYTQGRAFSAPRQQSLERQHAERAQMNEIRNIVDGSPRKNAPSNLQPVPSRGLYLQKNSSALSFGTLSAGGKSSSTSGGSLFGSIRYHTPPPNRSAQHFDPADDPEISGLRDRLRRMHSFDSMHSKKSIARVRSKKGSSARNQSSPPIAPSGSMRRYHIAPHTLGLASSCDSAPTSLSDAAPPPVPHPPPVAENVRPATSMGLRERFENGRFAFLGVRRRASGGVRGKGKLLIQKVRQTEPQADFEAWI